MCLNKTVAPLVHRNGPPSNSDISWLKFLFFETQYEHQCIYYTLTPVITAHLIPHHLLLKVYIYGRS